MKDDTAMEEEVMTYPGTQTAIDYGPGPIDPATGKTEAESGSVINRLFTLEQQVEQQGAQIDVLQKVVKHMAQIIGVKI